MPRMRHGVPEIKIKIDLYQESIRSPVYIY